MLFTSLDTCLLLWTCCLSYVTVCGQGVDECPKPFLYITQVEFISIPLSSIESLKVSMEAWPWTRCYSHSALRLYHRQQQYLTSNTDAAFKFSINRCALARCTVDMIYCTGQPTCPFHPIPAANSVRGPQSENLDTAWTVIDSGE